MLMLFSVLAFGQGRTITGTVVDENGAPIPGATVQLKGTRAGSAADNSGVFKILAKTGDVLVVSGAGLEPTEFKVGADNTVRISVKRVVATGTEVVNETMSPVAKRVVPVSTTTAIVPRVSDLRVLAIQA